MRQQVRLDAKTFHKRARNLLSSWKASLKKGTSDEFFQGASAILAVIGELQEDYPYQKSIALESWLLGLEIPNVLILFTTEKIYFVTSESRANMLEDLKLGEKQIPIEILKRTKDTNHNRKLLEQICNIMLETNAEKRIGILPKQKYTGSFLEEWQKVYENIKSDIQEVDVSAGVASSLSIKDEDELLAEEIQTMIETDKTLAKSINVPDLDLERLESCYTPIIQSGGKYDLKSSAQSTDEKLHTGSGSIVLCSLGARYKYYCSNIGRTILIQATKTQERNYQFLLDLQRHVLEYIKDGTKIRDVYSKAIDYIKSKRPDLENAFVKTLGFGMGIEFREGHYLLNPKNTRELKSGMVLNLSIGFQNLKNEQATDDKRSENYSLLVIDTVRVTNDRPIILTDYQKTLDSVSYTFMDEGKSDQEAKKENKRPVKQTEPKKAPPKKSAVLRTKFRSEEQREETKDQQRRAHQRELAALKQAEGLARFAESSDQQTYQQQVFFQKFESYKRDSALPKEVKELKIVVDQKNESIILPIYGFAVPFHISTLKNASKSEEGDYTYLRLNFLTPNQASGKKEDMPFDDTNATFVRAVSYRSTDPYLSEIHKKILDLKKSASKKEAERKERADIVEQDKLIELKGRRPQRLSEVFARPGLEGKRAPGELEIHQNGLRYHASKTNQKIDILFSNVKHMFFQPCDNELIVLLHAHLKNPIMIGKKKTKDIQFYREASDVQFDETGNRKRKYRYGDEDELGAEQEERRRRAQLNKEFKSFAEKIADATDRIEEIEVPYRNLGFNGVPFRTNVLLQPTNDALVHLTDPPFLVITLADIEIAHLERVQYGLKHFDIVFVFKDYSRPPVHINTIPMEQLENVKEWLDNVDVTFTEGPVNLNWTQIMKTINADPAEFYKEGGWSFLAENEDGEGSDASSDSASEYQLSESEADDDDSGSSYDEDASDDSASVEEETEESD
ncbi:12681_t:CDS:10 [Ambispora leptoticha]|uniref:FACT complex subunit n=1 Tax=Ambispora leptoticha TaxID=144679 RepID=A0A9N9AMT6_9GLOM|nr:12681_t:CDS:10 [Ambispora leptoticha]